MLFEPAAAPLAGAVALVEAASGRSWTYAELELEVERAAAGLRSSSKALVAVLARNDPATVTGYLGALRAGHAVLLLDAALEAGTRDRLLATYPPDFVLEGEKLSALERVRRPALHPDLALLLSTSGSTGSPKLVRLSRQNVLSNARAIAAYLGLGPGERAIASLPLHYTYGLSVLHSHLVAGAAIVLTADSVLRPGFWETFRGHGCTSLAGVPYTYQMLARVGFEKLSLPTLRTLTQAGGRLDPELVRRFHAAAAARGARLFVMYGQTEATARMAYLPPENLPAKAGSIGVAIPGGTLEVREGELVYRGPNVMLGYASNVEDLGRGDEQGGELRTGDLGRRDDDGLFAVTGRLRRFSKVYGLRVSLDELEETLRPVAGSVAVVGQDDERIAVFCEEAPEASFEALRDELARRTKLNVNTFAFRRVGELPRLPSGKVDYAALGALA